MRLEPSAFDVNAAAGGRGPASAGERFELRDAAGHPQPQRACRAGMREAAGSAQREAERAARAQRKADLMTEEFQSEVRVDGAETAGALKGFV